MDIIHRDYRLNSETDFERHVQPLLSQLTEAEPLYTEYGDLVGWKIQGRYE